MRFQIHFLAVATRLHLAPACDADEAAQSIAAAESNTASAQLPYSQLAITAQPESPQPILQTQYEPPVYPDLTYVPPYPAPTAGPAGAPVLPPPCCDVCGSSNGCECDVPWCRSGWKLGLELYGLQSNITDNAFGPWPDDGGGAAEISLGYEWLSGFGIRANWWSFFEDANVQGPDVELSMGTFQLDFYKAIVAGHSELLIGAGPAGGVLKFRIPSLNDRTEFRGGGASVFAEGYYPFLRRPLWELAFVGASRMTLLTGDWRDSGGGIVDDTDGDSMSIWEIGFGLEFRHRFGKCYDNFWFLQAMPEHQVWTSEWMGDELGSSVALSGLNLNLGFSW